MFKALHINEIKYAFCSLIFFYRREHLEAQRNSMDKSERSSSFEGKTQSTGPTVDTKTVMTTTPLVNGKASVGTTTMTETRTMTVSTSPMSTLSVDTKVTIENKIGASLDASVNPPTIVMSSVTPPAISPTTGSSLPLPGTSVASTSGSSSPVGSPNVNNTPTHPLLSTRRDSTTQVAVIDKVLFCDEE